MRFSHKEQLEKKVLSHLRLYRIALPAHIGGQAFNGHHELLDLRLESLKTLNVLGSAILVMDFHGGQSRCSFAGRFGRLGWNDLSVLTLYPPSRTAVR
jgi:hypothetical protein